MNTGKIILKHTLTIFNLVNLVLALMIISVGAYKNLLFLLIAIANTLIGIINELRAEHTIKKLRLISEKRPTILKDGKTYEIKIDEIKKGDCLVYKLGDQILVDAEVKQGSIEVNESFITGEQENILKTPGDQLLSGSFIVSGSCQAIATADLKNSLVGKLESSAKTIQTADSKLFKLVNNIVKYISFALIPVGALLLAARFRVPDTTPEIAVTSTVAGLISMIPEGLVLLTSSVLALATIRLSRKKVLVQDLYAVETLARVDCIALDKTGTLTTGRMAVHDFLLPDDTTFSAPPNVPTPAQKSFLTALTSILSHQTAENATITALKKKFAKTGKYELAEPILKTIDFSSERKHSGIKTETATYLLGAVEFITDDEQIINQVKSVSAGYRTLAVIKQSGDGIAKHGRGASSHFDNGHGPESGTGNSGEGPTGRCENDDCESRALRNATPDCELLGCIRLEDEIRSDAPEIIQYFYNNDIDIRVISGDDLEAVTAIAEKVGLQNPQGVDLSTEKSHDYSKLAKNYNIFTRVTPSEKKHLIRALKKAGKTVAMTGDGVNDILAMKEADCSLAIGEGSDAARRSAKFVLLNNDFAAVPSIIDEGRQSINNLERSATLFLSKNAYAAILAVFFIFLPFEYPYAPIEMSLLNFLCIGFPGLALALEKNTTRIKDRFIKNLKTYALPAAFLVALSMLILASVAEFINLDRPHLLAFSALITFLINLTLLYRISKPLTAYRATLFILIIAIFAAAFLLPFSRAFFDFAPLI